MYSKQILSVFKVIFEFLFVTTCFQIFTDIKFSLICRMKSILQRINYIPNSYKYSYIRGRNINENKQHYLIADVSI